MSRVDKLFVSVVLVVSLCFTVSCVEASRKHPLDKYNIIWDSPSKGMDGSMPIGNGDIGSNVWMEENGDLVFYISRTDSWGDNGRLLKVGRVRISLKPAPSTDDFLQTLSLVDGTASNTGV